MPDRTSTPPTDRYSMPRDIPDAAFWTPDGTAAEARARADAALGRSPPTQSLARSPAHPAGRGWIPESRSIGLPGEDWPDGGRSGAAERAARLHRLPNGRYWYDDGFDEERAEAEAFAPERPGAVFTAELQVRFLDQLAVTGNVRLAAGRAGVSHETVYRLRRRNPRFAALWKSARVHARERCEAALGDRALDGVLEEVWYKGECVGHRRRFDSRLLLAHLARLDKLTEDEPAEAAELFDLGLAALAGHAEPAGFAEAAGLWQDREPGARAPDRPPTRDEYSAWCAGRAIEGVSCKRENAVFAAAKARAARDYDAWQTGAQARIDRLLSPDSIEQGTRAEDIEATPPPGAEPAAAKPATPNPAPPAPEPSPSARRPASPRKRTRQGPQRLATSPERDTAARPNSSGKRPNAASPYAASPGAAPSASPIEPLSDAGPFPCAIHL